jgi:release factor glutamine methyltransferase
MRPVPTAEQLLRDAERLLRRSPHVDHGSRDKEWADAEDLLMHALGHDFDVDDTVNGAALKAFQRMLRRREAGEPVAYITGRTTFRDIELEVGPGAFIPRQSSEWMAAQAIRRIRRRSQPVHVDLATGIGPVALSVATAVPHGRVFGVDLFSPPLAYARRNARRLSLPNASFLRGDLFEPLPASLRGRVDAVTIHPPYVGRREIRELPEEILRFEPVEALTDRSPRGDRIVKRVAAEGLTWLAPGGWLLVEVSPDRARVVGTILRRAGYRDVRSTKGPVPVTRVMVGRA